jgi:hypothetical protein
MAGRVHVTTYDVGYFVGSLSSTSINRVLSRALIRVAPEDLEFTEIPIGNLPLYSQDHDAARTTTPTIRPRPGRSRRRSAPLTRCSS